MSARASDEKYVTIIHTLKRQWRLPASCAGILGFRLCCSEYLSSSKKPFVPFAAPKQSGKRRGKNNSATDPNAPVPDLVPAVLYAERAMDTSMFATFWLALLEVQKSSSYVTLQKASKLLKDTNTSRNLNVMCLVAGLLRNDVYVFKTYAGRWSLKAIGNVALATQAFLSDEASVDALVVLILDQLKRNPTWLVTSESLAPLVQQVSTDQARLRRENAISTIRLYLISRLAQMVEDDDVDAMLKDTVVMPNAEAMEIACSELGEEGLEQFMRTMVAQVETAARGDQDGAQYVDGSA